MAAMMGADEFGIATTSLIAMDVLWLDNATQICPVGICTQREDLRKSSLVHQKK